MKVRFGIVGAGVIGLRRAAALAEGEVVVVTDLVPERAAKLASQYGAQVSPGWRELVTRPDVDAVIVATSNDVYGGCVCLALESGKHVLAEKPAGRRPDDIQPQIDLARRMRKVLHVGFNHRFHPAILRAKELLDAGEVGPLMYIRARYGHGARVGYDREWRADRELSGGGELLDQGVHLIDLCRFFGGEFELEIGRAKTFFWDMPVEDNGFMLLKSPDGKRSAFLHASCTEWKNLFDFEIFGRTGKLQIFGLGRSYGVEELRFYKMKPEMGPPDTQIFTYPGEDLSWRAEMQAFRDAIAGKPSLGGDAVDALKAVEIVHEVYRLSGYPSR